MATTTIGELLLRLETEGDRQTVNALQRIMRYTDNAGRSVRGFGTQTNLTSAISSSFNRVLGKMFAAFSVLTIIDKVTDAIGYFSDKLWEGVKRGFEYNTNLEYTTAAIKALVGSEKVANEMTEKMVKLAAETPFQIQHYAKAAKTLLGYGVAQEEILPTMEMLGNASLGNAAAFDKLSLAYGQVMGKTKLQAEEVRQMINQGFVPLEFISKNTGIAMSDLQAKMKKGEITAKMLKDAFISATTGTGRYKDTMDALSNTYKGQSEKIQEYGDIFWGKVTKPLYDFSASVVLPTILSGVKKLTAGVDVVYGRLGNTTPKIIGFFKAFIDGDPHKIYVALKDMIPEPLKDKMFNLYVISLKLRDGLKWVKEKAEIALNYLKDNTESAFKYWKTEVKTQILPVMKDIIDAIQKMDWSDVKKGLSDLKTAFITTEPYIRMFAKLFIKDLVEAAKAGWKAVKVFVDYLPDAMAGAEEVIAGFVNSVTLVIAIFKGDMKTAKKAATDMTGNVTKAMNKASTSTVKSWSTMATNVLVSVAKMNINTKTKFGEMTGYGILKSMDMAANVGKANNAMKNKVALAMASMYTTTKNKMSSIKSVASAGWAYVRNRISEYMTSAKTKLTAIMVSIHTATSGKIQSIKNLWNGLKTSIKKILSFSLWQSGRNLINSFIDGFKSKFQSLKNAASTAASYISKYLKWMSPTKEGEGKDSDKWIPNLIDMMAAGFYKSKNKLSNAAGYASGIIANGLTGINTTPGNLGLATAGGGFNTTNNSSKNFVINVYADNRTNGRKVGKDLIAELNDKGILTHKGI